MLSTRAPEFTAGNGGVVNPRRRPPDRPPLPPGPEVRLRLADDLFDRLVVQFALAQVVAAVHAQAVVQDHRRLVVVAEAVLLAERHGLLELRVRVFLALFRQVPAGQAQDDVPEFHVLGLLPFRVDPPLLLGVFLLTLLPLL